MWTVLDDDLRGRIHTRDADCKEVVSAADGATGISAPHAGEARPRRGVASVRHSQQPFSGDLTGVLRETPVAPVGLVANESLATYGE